MNLKKSLNLAVQNIKSRKGCIISILFLLGSLFIAFHWELFSRTANQGNGRWRYAFFVLFFCILLTYIRFILTCHRKTEIKPLGIPGFLISSVFFGICWHFTLELIFNVDVFKMRFIYTGTSICIAALVFASLLLIFNSLRVSVVVGSAFYFIWGIAEFYVEDVRGVPVQIHDLFDIPTAMDVAGNYTYQLAGPVLTVLTFLILVIFNIFISDRYVLNTKKAMRCASPFAGVALLVSLVLVLVYGSGFEKLGISILGSTPMVSFKEYGTQLAFIEGVRCSIIREPEGYSVEELSKVAGEYSQSTGDSEESKPNIIVIMNESFADVDLLGRIGLAEEIMPNYLSLSENTVKGKVMINSIGGGTGKSEYEFLTGQSMRFFGSQITPYVMFSKQLDYGIPMILKEQGYTAYAVHPFTATNYNRKRAYEIMGFDQFFSAADFKGAEYYSQYISDKACYEKIYELVEETDDPLFTFCVTMQNHSPYDFEWFEPTVTLEDIDCPNAEQYLSLVQEADRQIESLINYFSSSDEETMIVFFGDHLPSLPNQFWEYVTGMPRSEEDFETQQKYYMTPFFIWTNYDIEEQEDVMMSTNYLGTYALTYAGVSLPAYNNYLLDLMEEVPAFSSFAYYGTDGQVHPHGSDEDVEKLLDIHDGFQYNEMFDEENLIKNFYTLE